MTDTEAREAIRAGLRPVELELVNQWLEDGKGVAIYENVDLGHPELGHRQYVTFGTPRAQVGEVAPERLPDIGDAINWRYMLVGTYRGSRI
jgi:hypothetical protein